MVVPLFEEEENVRPLVHAVRDALGSRFRWDMILVDDGSTDGTYEAAWRQAEADSRVRVLRLARNYGQTTALQAGFDHARGEIIVSLDGDLQNDPEDIPRLVERLRRGADLVVGYRESRSESLLLRRLPSWAANRLIRAITKVPIRDNGCTLKAFRRSTLEGVRLYSDMHRFIPAVLASRADLRVEEIPVRHHPRRFGRSKYGLSRIWKVLADLLTLTMLRWFRERPLRMFAWGAAGSISAGSVSLGASIVAAETFRPFKATAIVLPGATLLWFGLAGYLLMLGLISEVAVREATVRKLMPEERGETP